MIIIQENEENIMEAVAAIKRGDVLVVPTDTVYGLVCDASNKKSVERIYKIKERPKSNPLPVFVKDLEMAQELAVITDKQKEILSQKWPGEYTFVFNRNKKDGLYGLDKNTIALRIPKYKLLNDLLELLDEPLVQTSANVSGKQATTEIKEILKQFEGQRNQPDMIVNAGDLPNGKPSTIIDLTGDKIKTLRK